jgi:serine/threonine-protein kinase RsbW
MTMSILRLTIDSNLSDVPLIAVAINQICVHMGMDEIQAGQVELCIAEAATNAIRHAYHGKRGQTVSIAVSTEINRLQIEVCDSGTPMPTEEIDRLIHGTEVVEVDGVDRALLKEGGRGLQIIHNLMDEVSYIREESLNRMLLTKYILCDRLT